MIVSQWYLSHEWKTRFLTFCRCRCTCNLRGNDLKIFFAAWISHRWFYNRNSPFWSIYSPLLFVKFFTLPQWLPRKGGGAVNSFWIAKFTTTGIREIYQILLEVHLTNLYLQLSETKFSLKFAKMVTISAYLLNARDHFWFCHLKRYEKKLTSFGLSWP